MTREMYRWPHDAVRVDHPGLGHLGHAEVDGDRTAIVVDDGPLAAVLGEEVLDSGAVVVVHDRVQLGALDAELGLLFGERNQLGVLLDARDAVRREEVEDHPAAAPATEVERVRRRPARPTASGAGRSIR